jgi:hypothetical protein
MVPYCTATKQEKYSDIYYEGTVSATANWRDDESETTVIDSLSFWDKFLAERDNNDKKQKLKESKHEFKSLLRKREWRKEQFLR